MNKWASKTLPLWMTGLVLISQCACAKKEPPLALDSFPVQVQKASRKPLEETLLLSGTLKAKNEAVLFSRVAGKLKQNLLREGASVKKNEAVALVERDEVGVTFEPAPVPSTLTGMVGRVYLDEGMHVGLDTPVALVVDDSLIIARSDVPERYLGLVAAGQTVEARIESYPNQKFKGVISKVSPVVDPQSRTAPMEVSFENPNKKLRSGMFTELTISVAKKAQALAVPLSAILEEGTPVLFVAKAGLASKQNVSLGLRTAHEVEITKGLAVGDEVIVSGLYGLSDGSPIQILSDTK